MNGSPTARFRHFQYNYNASNFKYPPSLDKYLKSTLETRYKYKDGDTEKEPANKGYLLNVNFEAKYNGRLDGDNYVVDEDYYTEKVSWGRWNFNEAKIGPEKFEIYAFNPELTIGWTPIAEIASSEVFGDSTDVLFDTDIRKYQTTVLLTPNGYNNKTKTNTTGLLKVLRNAKHYYKIVFPQTENTPEMALGDTKDIYAYRQITDEELTKCACLIIADAIYQGGISKGGTRTTQGNVGSFFTKHHSSSKTLTWGTNNEGTNNKNYVHVFRGGVPYSQNKDFISPFIVKIEDYEKDYCVNYAHLFNLVHNKIEISCKEIPLSTYNGILKINAGKEGIATTSSAKDFYCLSLTLNEKKMVDFTDNNKTEYQKWFPINMFSSDRDAPITKFTESEPLYNGEWW